MDRKYLLFVLLALTVVCHTKKEKKLKYRTEILFGGLPFKVKGNLTLIAKTKAEQQRIELNSNNADTYINGGTALYDIILPFALTKIHEIGLTFNDTDPQVKSTIYIRNVILKNDKKQSIVDKVRKLLGKTKSKKFCVEKGKEALTETQESKLTESNCE